LICRINYESTSDCFFISDLSSSGSGRGILLNKGFTKICSSIVAGRFHHFKAFPLDSPNPHIYFLRKDRWWFRRGFFLSCFGIWSAHRRPRDDFAIHLLISALPLEINQRVSHEVDSYFVPSSVIFVVKVFGSFIRRVKALL
jgi:hypothetical protein